MLASSAAWELERSAFAAVWAVVEAAEDYECVSKSNICIRTRSHLGLLSTSCAGCVLGRGSGSGCLM
jgi:hypothetical protein